MRLFRVVKRVFNFKRPAANVPKSLILVGFGTYGAENLILHSWDQTTKIKIANFCSIADNVQVYLGGNHNTKLISTYPFGTGNELIGPRSGHPLSNGDINIGNDVWIGSHASIMSGVTIGDGAVIAAHSHVVKDVSPYEIVGGNPAQHIRFRFSPNIIEKLIQVRWWDLPAQEIYQYRDLLTSTPTMELLEKLK
jgi:acetyltransferase-like isoleucine patch superfamily enzyme